MMRHGRDQASIVRNLSDPAERYPAHLQFLWDQYNKLLGLAILASAVTLGFLLQGVLFNKDAREVMTSLEKPLNTKLLIASIILAGVSGVFFVICRWFSQVLMERQVYGDYAAATKYFRETLSDETIWPTALHPRKYIWFISRLRLLRIIGVGNEILKWIGTICIVASWICGFLFAWPLIEPLSTVAPVLLNR